jgi:septal ring factor EnvC (AmiA/AmiB activator)
LANSAALCRAANDKHIFMAETKPDQADILASNAKLEADLKAANETIKTLTGERDAAVAVNTGLSADVATLKTDLATARTENAGLKASQTDFDAKVAAKVAELGISETAIKTETASKPATREEVLAQYNAITDPNEKTKFYRANKAAFAARPTV